MLRSLLTPSVPGVIVVFALSGLACGESDGGSASPHGAAASSSASGSGGGAGGSGGAGGGSTCPEGAHPEGDSCAATLSGWTAGPSLANARDHHVTFVAKTPSGTFLYVAGGATLYATLDGIERAPIGDGGSLAPFAPAGKLPEALAGPGFVEHDRTLVLVGGLSFQSTGAASVADTFVGTIADDGTIAFAAGPPMITSRYHVTLSEDRGYVYAVGGLEQGVDPKGNPTQQIVDAVERAPFDGKTLGAFTALAPLPQRLTHHAAVVREHELYLIGGISGLTTKKDVLRASIDESGNLSAFEPAGSLPEPRATASAFVFLDQLYVLCGSTSSSGGEVATVLRAPFLPDKSVGAFEELAAVPEARAHTHQTPLFGSTIYSAAGSHAGKVEAEVFLGHLE